MRQRNGLQIVRTHGALVNRAGNIDGLAGNGGSFSLNVYGLGGNRGFQGDGHVAHHADDHVQIRSRVGESPGSYYYVISAGKQALNPELAALVSLTLLA